MTTMVLPVTILVALSALLVTVHGPLALLVAISLTVGWFKLTGQL